MMGPTGRAASKYAWDATTPSAIAIREHPPRTISGKTPSRASLLREHEYLLWLEQRVAKNTLGRDDAVCDESYASFMAERRAEQEKQRLKGVAEERREQRWKERGFEPRHEHVDAREAMQYAWIAFCKEQEVQCAWPADAINDKELRRDFVAVQRKAKERERQRKRTETRRAERETAGLQGRKRGRPKDPHTEERRRARLEEQCDRDIASAGPDAAQHERKWFAEAGQPTVPRSMCGCNGSLRRCDPRGWPREVVWWRNKTSQFLIRRRAAASGRKHKRALMVAAGARALAANAKFEAAMGAFEATVAADATAAQAAVAQAEAKIAHAVSIAAAASAAESVYFARVQCGRATNDADVDADLHTALVAEGVADVEAALSAVENAKVSELCAPPPKESARPRSTEAQCEGKTRYGERCRVHKSSKHSDAEPLRRGERFCRHHNPLKFTGVRCAGIKKHSKGQCRVCSGSPYDDAAPLRRGSPYCHHHRVRCGGETRFGTRCTVTSSSEHEHAGPLRKGEAYCAHHQAQTHADSDSFSMVLGAWGEECDVRQAGQRDDADDDFCMALGEWGEECDVRQAGERDDADDAFPESEDDEAFCMALGAWGEESGADSGSDSTDSDAASVERAYSPNPSCLAGDWD